MTLHYYPGVYQPDHGEEDEYDGSIWVVEPDHPAPGPLRVAAVDGENAARELCRLLNEGEALKARRDALLAALAVALPALDRAAFELDSGYFASKADEVRAAVALARKEPPPMSDTDRARLLSEVLDHQSAALWALLQSLPDAPPHLLELCLTARNALSLLAAALKWREEESRDGK